MHPILAAALCGLIGTLAGGAVATAWMSRQRRAYAFTTVADSARAKLWMSDPRGRTRFINRRLREFLGPASPGAGGAGGAGWAAGDGWRDAIHSEDREVFDRLLHAALVDHESVDAEVRLRNAAGVYRWMRARLAPIASADGAPGGLVGLLMDVTAEFEARRALEQTERALGASELKFRTLYEAAPLAIVLNRLDDGRFLEANPGFHRMTGYEPEELGRLGAEDLLAPLWGGETNRMLVDLRHRGAFGPIERECVRKDGSRFHVLVNGVRIRPPDGVPAVWSVAQDITERKKAEGELRRAAHFDRLTGLGNRELLAERLDGCIRLAARFPDQHFALLYLDMDRFKNINDSLGHAAGDEMLKEVAVRLRSILRSTDELAHDRRTLASRFGGDEFVILLNGLRQPRDAERVANRVLRELCRPYRLLDREFRSSASIGIVASGGRLRSAEEYLRDADTAMYEAKTAGRGRSALFDDRMSARVRRRVLLENELANAQACEQLFLVYQPQISLDTGALYGCEALLRWQHPELGLVSPSEFIPIAEDSGLILELGDWVLLEACRQFSAWRAQYGENAVPRIGINLSRAQLMLEDIDRRIGGVLEAFRIEPACVHLEITETAVMRDHDTALTVMNRLRALGVHLDLDDFGTGYSSLSCLSEFPLHTIKMDRTFLQRRHSADDRGALIEAATSLAHRLGLLVIAEGIETREELALLKPLGCHIGQGYLFAKPLSPRAFEEFIGQPPAVACEPAARLAPTGTDPT